jgi:hypothetical protein
MALAVLPKTWATGAPFDKLTPADLNANFEELRDAVNAIDTAQISDGAVTAAKLGTAAVGTTQIATGAVTAAKIGAQAVEYAKVADGDIGADKLNVYDSGDQAVTSGDNVFAHGLTDDAGANRTPTFVMVFERLTIAGSPPTYRYSSQKNGSDVEWEWDDTNVTVNVSSGTDVRIFAF